MVVVFVFAFSRRRIRSGGGRGHRASDRTGDHTGKAETEGKATRMEHGILERSLKLLKSVQIVGGEAGGSSGVSKGHETLLLSEGFGQMTERGRGGATDRRTESAQSGRRRQLESAVRLRGSFGVAVEGEAVNALQLSGVLEDGIDPIGAFVVDATAAYRLREIVDHRPRPTRQVAQVAVGARGRLQFRRRRPIHSGAVKAQTHLGGRRFAV